MIGDLITMKCTACGSNNLKRVEKIDSIKYSFEFDKLPKEEPIFKAFVCMDCMHIEFYAIPKVLEEKKPDNKNVKWVA